MYHTTYYLYMECQECPETADAYAVDAFVPYEACTIGNLFEAILGFNFFDYIKDAFQLLAR